MAEWVTRVRVNEVPRVEITLRVNVTQTITTNTNTVRTDATLLGVVVSEPIVYTDELYFYITYLSPNVIEPIVCIDETLGETIGEPPPLNLETSESVVTIDFIDYVTAEDFKIKYISDQVGLTDVLSVDLVIRINVVQTITSNTNNKTVTIGLTNDFSLDSSCVGWYTFEDWYSRTDDDSSYCFLDSKNSNDLIVYSSFSGLTHDTDRKEGTYSLRNVYASGPYIADTNSSSNFPLKSTDTIKKGTWVLWWKYIDTDPNYSDSTLISKFSIDPGGTGYYYNYILEQYFPYRYLYSLRARRRSDGMLVIDWGYEYGSRFDTFEVCILDTDVWYHIGISFDGVNRQLSVRVHNSSTLTTNTFSFSPEHELHVCNIKFAVTASCSAYDTPNIDHNTCNIDETVIFNRQLNMINIDAIRDGRYIGSGTDILGIDVCEPIVCTEYNSAVYIEAFSICVNDSITVHDRSMTPWFGISSILNDPTCVALYRFEQNYLGIDEANGQNLTSVNSPTYDLVNYKEGSSSTVLDDTLSQYYKIADENLIDGFPFKSNDTSRIFTWCVWHKVTPRADEDEYVLIGKDSDDTWDGPSLMICPDGEWGSWWVNWGGNCWEPLYYVDPEPYLIDGRWYHFAISVDAVNKRIHARIYDSVTEEVTDFYEDDPDYELYYDMPSNSLDFRIGAWSEGWDVNYDLEPYQTAAGNIDSVVIFNRWLSWEEIDIIRGSLPYSEISTKQVNVPDSIIIQPRADWYGSDPVNMNMILAEWSINVTDNIKQTDVATSYTNNLLLNVIESIVVSEHPEVIGQIFFSISVSDNVSQDTNTANYSIQESTTVTLLVRPYERFTYNTNVTDMNANVFYPPGYGGDMCLAVMPGEYRINGVIRTLAATMNVTGLGLVADIVLLDPAPVNANTYRYDIIAANTSGLVDYVKGTASANPVFPALSSTQMMLAFVLVPNGMVTVHQSNVGQYFSTPVISNITFTIENNPFPWDPTEPYDNTTNVTVNFVDQYGDLIYMSGTTTSLEILAGTGTFDSLVKEASGVNHVTFVYTRLHDIGESSPYVMVTVTMTEGSRYLKNFFRIALLDVNGNELP